MPTTKLAQFVAAGAYVQARQEAERLLLSGGLPTEQQGRVCRLACLATLHLGDLFTAARFGKQALEHAEASRDWETLGLAHFDLGCTYTDIGDTHLALAHLEGFLTALPEMPCAHPREEAAAYSRMVAVHRQRRDWPQAIDCGGRALRRFRLLGREADAARTGLDLAWSHLMAGQPASAAPHLAEVESYLAVERDDRLSAELLCRRALCLRMQGNLALSTTLCQEVFAPGRPGVGDRHLAEAAWVMGENALDLDHLSEARSFAALALAHAVKGAWPSLMNLAGDLRRRIALRSGSET